VKAFILC